MAKQKKPIEQYEHRDKQRVNNPPVGLVSAETDPDGAKKTYAYDPHLDPQLQWAGKTERTSFEIPTVSLHVHERIDPRSIIETVRKKNGSNYEQMSLFNATTENPPLRDAIEFYKHRHNWSNRLIAGDSLLVMNSLLEKEGLGGQVQMVYFDPPYGIKYGSNFQPFVNKRDVKDGKDEDLTAEPEMIKAFRDTWELGIHSYLTYLRDRLLLARELLAESGSVFVQISDSNVHHVREILDEVFGERNFVSQISYSTAGSFTSDLLSRAGDYVLWYAKDKASIKYRELYQFKTSPIGDDDSKYDQIELRDGTRRAMTQEEKRGTVAIPKGSRVFRFDTIVSQGFRQNTTADFEFEGKTYHPGPSNNWKATIPDGMNRLNKARRIASTGSKLAYVRYFDDFPARRLTNIWSDIGGSVQSRSDPKVYVVQTGASIIERCLLMTTDPGDLVVDITCGSGTTAFVAEQWGRRWTTCDTSRVALSLAKQRLMTANFEFYELAHSHEGVGSGLKYKSVPHVTLKSIANAEPAIQETLYDQPIVNNDRARVTGPFTVEAVPAPTVRAPGEVDAPLTGDADASVARTGATARHVKWRDALLAGGIRGKNGQYITFSRIEPLAGMRWLHADGETKPNDKGAKTVREPAFAAEPQRVVFSFGPEHAPLEQRQVQLALDEARKLMPLPHLIVFTAFQFDPEAAKDIAETKWPGITLLQTQMNADLQTDDLKKKLSGADSFWLVGQPDVRVIKTKAPKKATGKSAAVATEATYQVEVLGFDYYNTRTNVVESGGAEKIAMWMLDTDYDGRSLFPRQVFFPMSGEKDGWSRLAKQLRAEIDEELIEQYRGTISLPFIPGPNKRIAVKIVDDRGIESLRVVEVGG